MHSSLPSPEPSLLPDAPTPSRIPLGAVRVPLIDDSTEPLRAQGEAEFRPIVVRTLLNRNANRALPFFWTINPYRGCEFDCGYCYARYTHEFLGHEDTSLFARRIYVKLEAAEALRRSLRGDTLRGRPVAMGTATDPYQPAEKHWGISRAVLEVLEREPDLDLSITTKSPLVLRDLDLLRRLASRNAVTVNITITTLNRDLARILERGAPTPQRRLETIRTLAEAGIPTAIYVMPILPEITDHAEELLRLLRAARKMGATIACGNTLHLQAAPRRSLMPILERHFADRVARYRSLYRDSHLAPSTVRDAIHARFDALRRALGFAERGPRRPVDDTQLSFDFGV
ncbi:MAG: radical SAM protein [Candidatus Eisenbacteria bacterium]|nr:radical SAM protein [Candidatus Eisenbacteria bacterium]